MITTTYTCDVCKCNVSIFEEDLFDVQVQMKPYAATYNSVFTTQKTVQVCRDCAHKLGFVWSSCKDGKSMPPVERNAVDVLKELMSFIKE